MTYLLPDLQTPHTTFSPISCLKFCAPTQPDSQHVACRSLEANQRPPHSAAPLAAHEGYQPTRGAPAAVKVCGGAREECCREDVQGAQPDTGRGPRSHYAVNAGEAQEKSWSSPSAVRCRRLRSCSRDLRPQDHVPFINFEAGSWLSLLAVVFISLNHVVVAL